MGRNFSGRQKTTLFIEGDGHCANCGAELKPGWHADHVIPYRAGGKTELSNGQALCPDCNLRKGGNSMEWPKNFKLRDWQQKMFEIWIAEDKRDFLLVAFPGSGKTIAALRVAHHLLRERKIHKIVVVVPSIQLKDQWKNDASNVVGIQLNDTWQACDGFNDDMNGVVVTYQAIAEKETAMALNLECMKKRGVLAIFDEVHHAADNKSWGNGLQASFENATYRLLLSGTPWRTDNNEISFVRYENRKSVADFTYSYADSLNEAITRQLAFWAYNGDVKWLSDGEFKEVDFYDSLAEQEARERLNVAIVKDGMPDQLITDAWEKLKEYREDEKDRDAGMLIIVKDFSKGHMDFIADKVRKITGADPVTVNSDDETAHKKIKDFRESSDPVIIAVRMVSEGIDIKRLRVLVYLTNIATELFFRQACGRVVRRRNDDDVIATVYLPADPILMGWAREIKIEKEHFLQEYYKRLFDDKDLSQKSDTRMLVMFETENSHLDKVLTDDQVLSPEDIDEARPYSERFNVPIEKMGQIIKQLIEDKKLEASRPVPYATRAPLQDQKNALLKNIHQTETSLAAIQTRQLEGSYDKENPNHKRVYSACIQGIKSRVNKAIGVSRHSATMDQLKRGFEHLQKEQLEISKGIVSNGRLFA